MKLNKKIIVPAFALLAGASLAGSVSGTIAWYQYSTRANVSYIGTSAGVIGNLQIRLKGGEWKTQIQTDDVLAYLASESIGTAVEPVTPGSLTKTSALRHGNWKEISDIPYGAQDPDVAGADTSKLYLLIDGINPAELYKYEGNSWVADDSIDLSSSALDVDNFAEGSKYINTTTKKLFEKEIVDNPFYLNPQFGVASYENWIKASKAHYVRIPLQLRFNEGDEQHLSAQDVYLTKLLIQKDTGRDANAADHGDLSEAIRVHFSAYEDDDEGHAVNRLVSKSGGTTLTHGKLRLANGDDFDKAFDDGDDWGFNGSTYDYVNYGDGSQNCYSAKDQESEGYYFEEEASATGWKEIALATGAVDPENENGQDGDFYLNSATGKLYKKSSGAWAQFSSFLSGAADPNLDTENVGNFDYYFKTGANKLFLRESPIREDISPILVSPSSNPNKPLVLENTDGRDLGKTVATSNPQKYLNVDVTIWVEGWQKFVRDGKYTSLWDRDLIGAMFDVGMQFAVQDQNA